MYSSKHKGLREIGHGTLSAFQPYSRTRGDWSRLEPNNRGEMKKPPFRTVPSILYLLVTIGTFV